MTDPERLLTPTTKPETSSYAAVNQTDLFQKHWFCVGLFPSGKTFKQDAESPLPFLEIMNRSVIAWVDYITDDPDKDIAIVAAQMGFSEPFIASLQGDNQIPYQDFDTELWMRFPSIQIRGTDVNAYPLYILMRKNFVFTIHISMVDKRFIRLRRYSDTILKKIPIDGLPEDKLIMLMTRIIDANNDSNVRHLRVIEAQGDDLNAMMMDPKTDRMLIGPKIYELKHALIVYMNALWESVDVLHALRYGDAELISNNEQELVKISVMVDEMKSQIDLAEHMSDVLASGLEVMQSIYNNQLQVANNKLAMVVAYLTILGTAILIPNTLATILGNAAFDMVPSDLQWYIPLMVFGTVIGVLGSWWWVKKVGLLPKRPD
ncbi:MAG TPA: CorA family divalent cation transporter [Dehalococcoidales bacterium]|nr:CorA family divalent cation transporter [Dehalococcoidales bacterium]